MTATRILVVDDDPVIRLLLQAHFRSRGFDCPAAADGDEALKVLDRSPIHVLVTDLEMPGMDGLSLLRAVRERGVITRCVVVTGFATIANLAGCLREGAVALVPKPLDDLTALDAAVDQALQQMQMWTAQMAAIRRIRSPGALRSSDAR